ncbi:MULTISPECIES: glycerol-3-phosphate 1-O-acyltransferase PlsY [Atopobiaceae]|uniref:Glycerol-3-phosphate acyltransferase n=1 Tax=Parafannyhessea umbonata TaxID=604330 RepID=A0A1H9QLX1_9ACTN|nr:MULTISPECIES: glycerol-3-phosphate 1-O-acyltransferase PlsY [Atopobiaceae]SEH60555.1 glycerol-3-phosphate acyltransferase PlsY [Parafannyhessea umbonata]SER61472.1 glycerol-3-phosphate acyltransferase PlsY [Parafannyhessea umbonata]SJZ81129.1 glycerol-3-phosphate acyltransferase PlsY [Olsenella sp. KH1P3]
MITPNALLTFALCAIGCFLVCGIPCGLIIARVSAHIDVRDVGSGNIGMTNVARSAGAGAAVATLLCDAGKGFLAIMLSRLALAHFAFGGDWASTLPTAELGWMTTSLYALCVLGHVFSPYLGFHGGKGISVGLGAGLGFCWNATLSMLGVFIVLAVPSGYVSLGSIFAALSLSFFSAAFGVRGMALVPLCLVSATVVWAHRSNIKKLLAGSERKFSVRHKDSSEDGR